MTQFCHRNPSYLVLLFRNDILEKWMKMNKTEKFLEHKNLLFSIAYDMLGSIMDAEDVLQDAYLRWMESGSDITYPKAYLIKTITNISINYLNIARKKRESYLGLWLPEPLINNEISEESQNLF